MRRVAAVVISSHKKFGAKIIQSITPDGNITLSSWIRPACPASTACSCSAPPAPFVPSTLRAPSLQPASSCSAPLGGPSAAASDQNEPLSSGNAAPSVVRTLAPSSHAGADAGQLAGKGGFHPPFLSAFEYLGQHTGYQGVHQQRFDASRLRAGQGCEGCQAALSLPKPPSQRRPAPRMQQ